MAFFMEEKREGNYAIFTHFPENYSNDDAGDFSRKDSAQKLDSYNKLFAVCGSSFSRTTTDCGATYR